MKVIAINGSPHKNGNTFTVLQSMADELHKENIEVEIIHAGDKQVRGCNGCGYCRTSDHDQCVFTDDILNETAQKMRSADGIILGSPTYYGGISGTMKSFLDRAFYSSSKYFKYKVGTSIAVVRRSGGVDVMNQLNNYFTLAETVSPPSQYWTVVYGRTKEEVIQDNEGMQTIRKNARAMAWLLKVIDFSKGNIPLPIEEERQIMNFIR